MDPFTILDVVGGRDVTRITELDGTVSSGDLVERDPALLDVILAKADENGILSSLSSD